MSLRPNRFSAAVIAAAGLSVIPAAHAGTIYSWENNAEGWVEASNPFPAVSTFSSTTGVTNGSYSLFTTGRTGYSTFARAATYGNAGGIKPLLSPAGGTLSVDVTIPSDSFVGTAYLQALFVMNGDGFYDQTTVDIPSDGLPHTANVPVTASELAASTGYFEFIIGVNTGRTLGTGNGAIYYDNVRFTALPEPAMLGAVVGVSSLLTRRRRTAC